MFDTNHTNVIHYRCTRVSEHNLLHTSSRGDHMELDTLTLAPENANKKLTPIEQAANQLIDTITRIITTQHADNTRTTHQANIRADNADREYTRLCHDYETLLAEHTALKQQIASTPHNGPETATE